MRWDSIVNGCNGLCVVLKLCHIGSKSMQKKGSIMPFMGGFVKVTHCHHVYFYLLLMFSLL